MLRPIQTNFVSEWRWPEVWGIGGVVRCERGECYGLKANGRAELPRHAGWDANAVGSCRRMARCFRWGSASQLDVRLCYRSAELASAESLF
jgi:hypothetical protein